MGETSKPMQRTGCDRQGADASQTFERAALHAEAGRVERLGWIWVERDDAGVLYAVHLPGLHRDGPNVPERALSMADDLRIAFERYVQGDAELLTRLPLAPAPTPFAAPVQKSR